MPEQMWYVITDKVFKPVIVTNAIDLYPDWTILYSSCDKDDAIKFAEPFQNAEPIERIAVPA